MTVNFGDDTWRDEGKWCQMARRLMSRCDTERRAEERDQKTSMSRSSSDYMKKVHFETLGS